MMMIIMAILMGAKEYNVFVVALCIPMPELVAMKSHTDTFKQIAPAVAHVCDYQYRNYFALW